MKGLPRVLRHCKNEGKLGDDLGPGDDYMQAFICRKETTIIFQNFIYFLEEIKTINLIICKVYVLIAVRRIYMLYANFKMVVRSFCRYLSVNNCLLLKINTYMKINVHRFTLNMPQV